MRTVCQDRGCVPKGIRLVAADMDGTLLDEHGSIPDSFWPLLEQLRERGVVFAAASGRQYPALVDLFGPASSKMALISENGAYVVRDGQELSHNTVDRSYVEQAVTYIRHEARSRDLSLIWSSRTAAYTEHADPAFVAEAGRFYTCLEVVEDLLELPEEPLKFAVYDAEGATMASRDRLSVGLQPHLVVMSGGNWMDVMDPKVNKGVALGALQRALGVGADQTMVFGDYLNDLEMFGQATHSYAMANGHADIVRAAKHVAPSNREHGVIGVLRRMIQD